MSSWIRCQLSLFCLLAVIAPINAAIGQDQPASQPTAAVKDVTQGALRIVQEDLTVVECPLKHTDVQAEVSGFVSEVRVTQTFQNPTKQPIEAVYVFPLPHGSAVHEMTMVVGERRIVGLIKRRADARAIYEQAIQAGQTAALLEQERPNIFTQTVGNIPPGAEIKIEIAYIDVLDYDMGNYEFHFPMVVGPRYNPGSPISAPESRPADLSGKVSRPEPNTTAVPDAARINPPVLKPEFRNGHDISLTVKLDAGVPIQNLNVANHRAEVNKKGRRRAVVTLSKNDSLPNKDFVLRYNVAGKKPEMALLAHTGNYSGDARRLGNGYFMLMIQPQEDERLTKSPPREMVFMVDISGSMRGQPTAKTIEAMQTMLGLCRPIDTVQVITFAGQATKLFDKAIPVDEDSIKAALNFTAGLRGRGGTEMLKGIKMAIDEPIDQKRLRIVVMLTDGYIGNEAQIIEHVGKNCGDQIRFWALGMGSSPNMFLIDGVARQGGGMGKRLGLKDDSESLCHEIMTRIQRAQLANVSIDWGDLQVAETYPARIPELWAGRPVILFGRYTEGGSQQITIKGRVEGEDVTWPLEINLSGEENEHQAMAKVWARKKIEDLMQQTFYAGSPAVEEEVTAIALDYRLMSQYTSFVAVDAKKLDSISHPARPPRRMVVPVPLPEGTSWEGFFGESAGLEMDFAANTGAVKSPRFTMDVFSRARARSTPVQALSLLGRTRTASGLQANRLSRLAQQVPNLSRTRRSFSSTSSRGSVILGAKVSSAFTGRLAGGGGFGRDGGGAGGFGGGGFGYGGITNGRELSKRRLSVVDASGLVALEGLEERRARPQLSAEQVKPIADAAKLAYETAMQFEKDGRLAQAREAFMRAYLLDVAVLNAVHAGGQVSAEAVPAIERIHAQQVKAWTKRNPALAKKLDLVIRDKSLAESLEIVKAAAEIKIELLAGSVADAASMQRFDVRVNYLDLRGATVAQALDWILHAHRMSWRNQRNIVIAGTDRRQTGTSTWIFDVSLLLPLSQELTEAGDDASKVAAKAAETLETSLRAHLKVDDPLSIAWFGSGHLLIVGDVERHATVSKWIDERLKATPKALVTQRKTALDKSAAVHRRYSIAGVHASASWQLLAAAAAGKLDVQALTELQIAWRSKQTAELLDGKSAAIVLRSLWCVKEAARALSTEAELTALATAAQAKARTATTAALDALEKNRDDENAFAAVLYAALAMRDDQQLSERAIRLLTESQTADSKLAPARTVARVLLANPQAADVASIVKMIDAGVAGPDMTVMLAIACRRAGDEAWSAFRRDATELLGNQPLAGSVLVLINRLSASQLELAKVQ